MGLSKLSATAISAAALVYPFAVYLSVGHVEPYWLAIALCVLSLLRAALTRDKLWALIGLMTAVLTAASFYTGHSWQMLKLYPVVVNLTFFLVFATSVIYPPTVIERIARVSEPMLPMAAVRYTRNVTLVWCVFFVLNGAAALATVLWASDAVWALYNGFLAYVAMALLLGVEWLVRPRMKARFEAGARQNAQSALAPVKDANA